MNERNRFIKKSGKYFLFFCLMAFGALVFFPQRTQAAITTQTTNTGFKLSGTGNVDLEYGDGNFIYYLDYSLPDVMNGKMDYKVDISITFHTTDPEMIPKSVELSLDYNNFSLHPNGANTCRTQKTFSTEYDFDMMEIEFNYGGQWLPQDSLDFSLNVNVQENRKKPEVKINPLTTSDKYEKTSEPFLVTVNDPYVMDPAKDKSQYSVRISDPSVAKISSIQNTGTTVEGGSQLNINVYFLKSGSAELIFKYQDVTAKQKFTVKRTQIFVPDSLTLHIGETPTLASRIGKIGGGSLTIKQIKSSNQAVVSVSGSSLIAKKTGVAKITAVINGKKQTIIVTVTKKPVPKPTLNQLKVSYTGYKYYPSTSKLYLKFRFKNNSKSTITKVTLKYVIPLDEHVTRTKTFSITIKPGKTVNKTLDVGKMIDAPDGKVSVKCLKFWYRS
ncbi:MAG: hypothetical protein Q4C91_03665 [Eubacteriales bacterium]|nr:hypothetical protein [Eubacteriales bacterium]